MQRTLVMLALLWLMAIPMAEAKPFRVQGAYGFDWLQPTTTRCRAMTPQDVQRFRACTFFRQGDAFAVSAAYHQCRVSARSEYFIYASRAQCQAVFETMQANAP